MKVCLLALTGPGGILDYGLSLAVGLAQQHEVAVVTTTTGITINNAKVYVLPRHDWYRNCFTRALVDLIIRMRPAVVHDVVGTADYKSAFVVSRLPKSTGPFVVSIHDPVPHSGTPVAYRLVHHMLTWALVRRANAVVVHGPLTLRILQQRFHPRLACVVPLPATVSENSPTEARLGKRVLFFGSLRWNKGVDRLLGIAAMVWARVPDAQFVVAGQIPKGPWVVRRRIAAAIRKMSTMPGFEINVGFVPPEQVGSYFQQASLVLLPYRDATQSGILSMAAAYGKCVVATRVGDIPMIVRHGVTGLIAERNSDTELAELVAWALLNPDEATRLGRALRQLAAERLTPQAVAQELVQVYRASAERFERCFSGSNCTTGGGRGFLEGGFPRF